MNSLFAIAGGVHDKGVTQQKPATYMLERQHHVRDRCRAIPISITDDRSCSRTGTDTTTNSSLSWCPRLSAVGGLHHRVLVPSQLRNPARQETRRTSTDLSPPGVASPEASCLCRTTGVFFCFPFLRYGGDPRHHFFGRGDEAASRARNEYDG